TGGTEIIAVVCPGLKRSDGTAITRARVLVDPKPKETPPPAPEHAAAAARAATAPAPVATLEAMQPPAVNGLVAAALPSEPPPPALPVEPVASALPAGTASVTPLALLPAANGPVLSLLDLSLSGAPEVRPEEAAAAAAAAGRATRVCADDASRRSSASRPRHPRFHIFQLPGKIRGQQPPLAVAEEEHLVLDAHAEAALGKIDARLDREDRAGGDRQVVLAGVVDVEADE